MNVEVCLFIVAQNNISGKAANGFWLSLFFVKRIRLIREILLNKFVETLE